MSYLGNTPAFGKFQKLNSIAGSFNGVTQSFVVTATNGTPVALGSATNCLISINGVLQEPYTDYTVANNTLYFSTPPLSGDTFFGVVLGDVGSVLGPIANAGNATLGDNPAADIHTLNGVTTVNANSTSAALTITQTGTGNALVVEDSTSPDSTPFVIDSGGKVGIGDYAPAWAKFSVGGTYPGSSGSTVVVYASGVINPAVATGTSYVYRSSPDVSTGTLPSLEHFSASQGTFTGSVTTQFGFRVSSTLTGATNNYGFYSNIASGTGRWNFYSAGTAANYFGGVTTFAKALIETKTAPTISTNALTLDISSSALFAVSLNANITTLTLSNPPASNSVVTFVIEFTADGTARTVTWPASVKWSGGTAPTLTSINAKKDAFVFYTYDGGATYIASIIGQNF